MSDYYLQDDDVSKLELDDSSGFLILDPEVGFDPTRISQAAVEVAVEPSDQKARISQVAVEVALEGDPKARVSQVAVEVAQRYLRESVTVVIWE